MNITEDIVLNTVIDVQPEHMYELQAAPARIFGLLVLELICKRVLLPTYGCQDFTPEKHGCDVVLKQCTQEPLRPEACLESKYVENFWLKEGTLLQQIKDAARKLRRVKTHDVAHRFLLVSSFALRQRARASDKRFKHAHEYVIVVLLMTSKAVEENPAVATQEIVAKTKKLTEEESLEAISNISVVMLNDKLAEFEDQVGMHFDEIEKRQDRIEENQQVLREKLQELSKEQQAIRKEQQLLRKGQQELAENVLELKTLLINALKQLTEKKE